MYFNFYSEYFRVFFNILSYNFLGEKITPQILPTAEEIPVSKFQSPTQVTVTYAKDCRNMYVPPMVVLYDF